MKKYIVLLVATAFIGTGCKDKYAEGFSAGESAGTSEGQTNGFNDGYSNGYDSSYQTNFNSGFSSGVDSGYASGYADGEVYYTNNDNYGAGFTDGFNDNYGIGQTDGKFPSYNYFEKIAVEWQRNKVSSLDEALVFVKQRKIDSKKQSKQFKKQKNVLPKDIESDWLEDYIDNL